MVDGGGRTTVTGATRAKQVLHRVRVRGKVRWLRVRSRNGTGSCGRMDRRMNSEFNSGVAWAPRSCNQILKFSNPSVQSIRALCHTRTRRPQLVGDGVITTFMPRSSLCPSLSASCSPPFTISRPPSATVCSLARFQVNQRQIQGRAQPNFGPPCKRWGWPPFYLSRNGRPLTIGLSASDGSS